MIRRATRHLFVAAGLIWVGALFAGPVCAALITAESSYSASLSVPSDLVDHPGQFFSHPSTAAGQPPQLLSLSSARAMGGILSLGALRGLVLVSDDSRKTNFAGVSTSRGRLRMGLGVRAWLTESRQLHEEIYENGEDSTYRLDDVSERRRTLELIFGLGTGSPARNVELTAGWKRADYRLDSQYWYVTRRHFESAGYDVESERDGRLEVAARARLALDHTRTVVASLNWSDETIDWTGALGAQSDDTAGLLSLSRSVYGHLWEAGLALRQRLSENPVGLDECMVFVHYRAYRLPRARARVSHLYLGRDRFRYAQAGFSVWGHLPYGFALRGGGHVLAAQYLTTVYQIDLSDFRIFEEADEDQRVRSFLSLGLGRTWRNLDLAATLRTRLTPINPFGTADVSIRF